MSDPARFRLPARVAVVFFGYLLYRWIGDERVVPGLFVWGGTILLGWTAVDRFTLRDHERMRVMQVGSALLGLGLLALGLYLGSA